MQTTLIIIGEPKAGIFEVLHDSSTIGTVTCEKASYKNPADSGVWSIDGALWCWVTRNTHGTVVGAYSKRSDAVDGLIRHHDDESSARRDLDYIYGYRR